MRKILINLLTIFLFVGLVTVKPNILTADINTVSFDEPKEVVSPNKEKPKNETDPEFNILDYIDITYAQGYTKKSDNSYSVTYDGNAKQPISNIAPKADQTTIQDGENFKYKVEVKDATEKAVSAIEPGNYTVLVSVTYKLVDSEESKEVSLSPISLTIEKIKVTPSNEKSKVYDGTAFVPKISVKYQDGTTSTLSNSLYTLENTKIQAIGTAVTNPIEPSNYQSDVVWSSEFLAHYDVADEYKTDLGNGKVGYTITYYIDQIEVKFAGWDILPGETIIATMGQETARFDWVNDSNGNISILYNGYSPLMFVDDNNDCALPDAKFVRADNGQAVSDIVRGTDYTYSYDIGNDAVMSLTRNVGSHSVYFGFMVTSHYKCSSAATYKVIARDVDVVFKNTCISSDSDDKRPTCDYYIYDANGNRSNVSGLAGMDDYLLYRVEYEYYDMAGNLLASQPKNEGQYRAKVIGMSYIGGAVDTNNYNVRNIGAEVNYVVGKNPQAISGTNVSVTSINHSSLTGSKFITPTKATIETIFEKGNVPTALKEAYKAGRHINLYIYVSDVDATRLSQLKLESKNSITVNVQLFGCIDDDTSCKRYQITYAGTSLNFSLTLSEAQLKQIGYTEDRVAYVDIYHDSNTKADASKVVVPYSSVVDDVATYTFVLNSDKFSEFSLYSKTKTEYKKSLKNRRIVPNTQR